MKILIISLLIYFITGCSFDNTYKSDIYDRDYIKMDANTTLYSSNKTFSVKAPINRGILFEGLDKYDDFTVLQRRIIGEIVEIFYLEIDNIDTFDGEKYLDLENINSFELNTNNPDIKYENETFGQYYDRAFVNIIDGIKCRSFPKELNKKYNHQNKGDDIIQTQEYETYCSFYGANGVPKVLRIRSEYSFNLLSEAFKKSTLSEKEMLNKITRQFRQDAEEIFSNIKINMDRQKMRQHGLLFNTKSKEIKWK